MTTTALLALAWLAASATQPAAAPAPAMQPATLVERLAGTWEGVLVGEESAGKITITFTGQALHFQGLTAGHWYDATFVLLEGTRPQRLSATITGCELERDIGKVVPAILKLEGDTLTLAGVDGLPEEPAEASAVEPETREPAPSSFRLDLGNLLAGESGAPAESDAFASSRLFHYRLRKLPEKK